MQRGERASHGGTHARANEQGVRFSRAFEGARVSTMANVKCAGTAGVSRLASGASRNPIIVVGARGGVGSEAHHRRRGATHAAERQGLPPRPTIEASATRRSAMAVALALALTGGVRVQSAGAASAPASRCLYL